MRLIPFLESVLTICQIKNELVVLALACLRYTTLS